MREPRAWTTRTRRKAFEHRLLDLELRVIEASGERREVLVLDSADWVNVIPVRRNAGHEELVLVRQWRYAIGRLTLEIPGGIVDPGETAEAAARRELLEETGYRCDTWRALGWVHPNPAILDNRCAVFLADGVEWAQNPLGDGNEEIEVTTVPTEQLGVLVASGEITHSLVLAALHLWHLARE